MRRVQRKRSQQSRWSPDSLPSSTLRVHKVSQSNTITLPVVSKVIQSSQICKRRNMIYDPSGSGQGAGVQSQSACHGFLTDTRRRADQSIRVITRSVSCPTVPVCPVALWLRSHSDLNIRNCLEYCEMKLPVSNSDNQCNSTITTPVLIQRNV